LPEFVPLSFSISFDHFLASASNDLMDEMYVS